MTKMSSQDAPAMISWGMLLSVPYRVSISCTIRGTTTAGDTAASTLPMTAASARVTPSSAGARRTNARISQLAGTNDIRSAGRPTRLRSDGSRDSPALSRMIMSAICRSSAEMERSEPSSRSSAQGPSTMPVQSMPRMRGSPSRWKSAPAARPKRKTKASDVSMVNLL